VIGSIASVSSGLFVGPEGPPPPSLLLLLPVSLLYTHLRGFSGPLVHIGACVGSWFTRQHKCAPPLVLIGHAASLTPY